MSLQTGWRKGSTESQAMNKGGSQTVAGNRDRDTHASIFQFSEDDGRLSTEVSRQVIFETGERFYA